MVNIVRKTVTAVDLTSLRIQAKARAKAKDVERAKAKDAAKVKEEDVEDGSSDHRLHDDGMDGMAMPKVTSQKMGIQILSKLTMIAVACISMAWSIARLLRMTGTTTTKFHSE